jgi:integrase/recombinase XerD
MRWQQAMLRRYETFAGHKRVGGVSWRDLADFVATVRQEEDQGKISRETARDVISVVKRLWKWISDVYGLPNPAAGIKLPIEVRQPSKALHMATVNALIEATPNTPYGIRNRAIMLVLLDTGCRLGGLRRLTLADVDFNRRAVTLREKGGHSRRVGITRTTADELQKWLAVRPKWATALFCSLRPSDMGNPLGPSGIKRLLRQRGQAAKVNQRVFAHAFRHTFATVYNRRGGSTRNLQAILGHKDIRTTERYIQIDEEALIDEHEKFSAVNEVRRGRYA